MQQPPVPDSEAAAALAATEPTPPPEVANGQAFYDALFPHALERFLEEDRKSRNAGAWLVGSAVLFVVFGLGEFDWRTLIVLMGVLVFHELGHLLAMWLFGYRDLKVFFIPMLGAAASGKSRGVAPWKKAVVLLAGPLPGIVAAYPILFFAAFLPGEPEWLFSVATMLLLLNGFNLLPFVPLDGGRLVSLALFSRSPRLETWFTVISASGLVALSVALEAWLLAGVGVFLAFGAFVRSGLVHRAHDLRTGLAGAAQEPADLTEQERRLLYDAAASYYASSLPKSSLPDPQAAAKMIGSHMRVMHERAITPPPRVVATVVILLVYVASFISLAPIAMMALWGSE